MEYISSSASALYSWWYTGAKSVSLSSPVVAFPGAELTICPNALLMKFQEGVQEGYKKGFADALENGLQKVLNFQEVKLETNARIWWKGLFVGGGIITVGFVGCIGLAYYLSQKYPNNVPLLLQTPVSVGDGSLTAPVTMKFVELNQNSVSMTQMTKSEDIESDLIVRVIHPIGHYK
jgi:hypothetical protein